MSGEQDREALAEALYRDGELGPGYMFRDDCEHLASRFLASDWLADHDRRVRASELREAAKDWPIGVCAHRCFRTDEHIAPKDCLYGPTWLEQRADRIKAKP